MIVPAHQQAGRMVPGSLAPFLPRYPIRERPMAKGLHPDGVYDRTVINRATEGAAEAAPSGWLETSRRTNHRQQHAVLMADIDGTVRLLNADHHAFTGMDGAPTASRIIYQIGLTAQH